MVTANMCSVSQKNYSHLLLLFTMSRNAPLAVVKTTVHYNDRIQKAGENIKGTWQNFSFKFKKHLELTADPKFL